MSNGRGGVHHEDTTCIHKEVTEVTEAGDGGLRITGERLQRRVMVGLRVMRLAGQGAGRGYNGDVHHKETKTRRQKVTVDSQRGSRGNGGG